MKRLVLLDFDGVVNTGSPPKGVFDLWEDFEETTIFVPAVKSAFRIAYSPHVVEFINSLHQREDVDVMWLSSWSGNTHLFKELGLNSDIPHLIPRRVLANVRHGSSWKPEAGALKILESDYDKVVWVDDESQVNSPVYIERIAQRVTPTQRVPDTLSLVTNELTGLTPDNIRDIKQFLGL